MVAGGSAVSFIDSGNIVVSSGGEVDDTTISSGGTLDDVCRVDVYVRNMEHFEAIHKVRAQYFKPPLPASTMVEITKMTSPDYLIEINAIAVIPK